MKVLIPWSGGLDSTALVFKALKEGHAITTVSFKLVNNNAQSIAEEEAREKIKAIIGIEYPNAEIKYLKGAEVDINCNTFKYHLSQPMIWIFASMFAVDDHDEIWMGYVLGDDALGWMEDMRNLYRAYSPFMEIKLPEIKFPLIKEKKSMIIESYFPEKLHGRVSFCENPDLVTINDKILSLPCGHCASCERHERELKIKISSLREVKIIDFINGGAVGHKLTPLGKKIPRSWDSKISTYLKDDEPDPDLEPKEVQETIEAEQPECDEIINREDEKPFNVDGREVVAYPPDYIINNLVKKIIDDAFAKRPVDEYVIMRCCDQISSNIKELCDRQVYHQIYNVAHFYQMVIFAIKQVRLPLNASRLLCDRKIINFVIGEMFVKIRDVEQSDPVEMESPKFDTTMKEPEDKLIRDQPVGEL